MNRRQRSVHLLLWSLIPVVVIAIIGLGLWERRRLDEIDRAAFSPGDPVSSDTNAIRPQKGARHVP